jgi:eukaryotic-like serine/threonine-protein kinase
MLNAQLAELEQNFRRSWKPNAPPDFEAYLAQVDSEDRVALLSRLLSVELEYAYQPPAMIGESPAQPVPCDRTTRDGLGPDGSNLTPSLWTPAHSQATDVASSAHPSAAGTPSSTSPDSPNPKLTADESDQCESQGVPAAAAPEMPAPEMPAPEMPAPEMPAPEMPAPEMPAPEMPAPGGAHAGHSEDDERARPRVHLFVLRFPELRKHREVLIQLVMLEFALRLRFDLQPPSYDSYLLLCPQDRDRLEDMLRVMETKLHQVARRTGSSGPVSRDDTTVAESSTERPLSLAQLPSSLGCFLLTDLIGQGGMGMVYAAIDLRSAAHVAVKVVRRGDSWSIYRFIEEFTWLANLSHPNIVRLYDTFSEGSLRYFSMELVEGQSLRDWFRSIRHTSQAWKRLCHVLSQAAIAVAFLHDQRVVHRDIKSSNLMIAAHDKAVLLDLGLASRTQDNQTVVKCLDGEHLIGTLPYMPPEALLGAPASAAGDWYSFGVMIFETITGTLPPSNIDPVTNQPCENEERDLAAEVRAQLHDCPEDLRELCVDLLRFQPSLRPDAASVISRLGSKLGQPISFSVLPSDFIGREDALDFLDQCLDPSAAGEVRLIQGESGLGKTTLLQKWRDRQRRDRRILWLQIRCRNQDHTPLRALNQLVQAMVTELSLWPPEMWLDLARGGGEEIVYLFPQVERLPGATWPSLAPVEDPMEASARRAVGLHALLVWLKQLSQRQQLVVVIDDAQWADAESGRMLAHLFRSSYEFRGVMVLVDQGQQVESPLLAALRESEPAVEPRCVSLELGPLSREHCLSLLATWKKRLDLGISHAAMEDMATRSAGSPFLLQEQFRAYVNYIVRHKLSDDTWINNVAANQGLTRSRYFVLPPDSERILQYLAVSDQALGIHQLQTASRILPAQLLAELTHLSGQGWIRWNGRTLDSEVEISHERFREVVLESMVDERLQRRHYRLARMLSSEVPPPWRRIAHHYAGSRHFREAAACYLEGARTAARHLAFPEALWLLERAFHPQAQRTAAEQFAARRLQADCLAGNGSAMAAAEMYHALALSSPDPNEQLLLQCLAGEQWIRGGKLRLGIECLRTALTNLRLPHDASLKDRVDYQLQTWRLAAAPPPRQPASSALHAFSPVEQTLTRLSGPLSFLDHELGSRLILRIVKMAERQGTSLDRAMAMMRWAGMLSLANGRWRQRAILWIRTARQLAREHDSPAARNMVQVAMFLWLSLQGRFRTALRVAQRVERVHQAHLASDTWESGLVGWLTLAHLWHQGLLRDQCRQTHSYRQDALQRSDTMWTFWMHVHAAHLSDLIADNTDQGRQALDVAQAIVADEASPTLHAILWVSRIQHWLYEERPYEALELLERDWEKIHSAGFLRISYNAWALWCLKANCHLACWARGGADAARHLPAAQHCARSLKRLKEPAFRCHALAYQLVIEVAGGARPAPARWQAAIQAAEKQHLGLLSMALRWHHERVQPAQAPSPRAPNTETATTETATTETATTETAAASTSSPAKAAFQEQGVVAPERLMNLILPLKRHA